MKILDFIKEFDNEKQLEVYLQYKKDRNITYQETFENWLEDNYIEVNQEWIYNNGDYIKCDNCGEWYEEDDMSSNDMITSGGNENICNYCVADGYAR